MKRSTALVISLGLIGAALLYSLLLFRSLPNPTPSHWDAQGRVNGYSNPWVVCFLTPAMMLVVLGIMLALPKMSPDKFRVDSWMSTYNLIVVLVFALFAGIHFIALSASRNAANLSPKLLVGMIFIFFAILGNFIGKVRRNFWVGVRTPWTLSSDSVWNIVHRRAGQLWVAAGILGAILVAVGLPFWVSFTLLIVSAFVPVVHSYFVWKRIEGPRAP